MPPEVRVVDRAAAGAAAAGSAVMQPFDQHVVDRGQHGRPARAPARPPRRRPLVEVDGGQAEHGERRRSAASARTGTAPMVTQVVPVLRGERRRSSSPSLRWSNRLSRSTERGISKQGEPSRPTPSRTSPSSGNHHLGREQAVVARPALRRVGDVVAEEVVAARSTPGTRRKDVLEKSALMIDSPSATIVPLPTDAQVRVVVLHLGAEVRPGLLDVGKVVPEPAQVVDDEGAVAEQPREELEVGQAGDRAVDR